MDDSTPLQPPFLGPGQPLYPDLAQVVRVRAPALVGTNVYPAFVAQFVPGGTPGSLRDREACVAWEPNGLALGPGYYDARLDGVYLPLGVPLYVVTCCPGGAFTSSSGSSSSPAAPPPGPYEPGPY